MPDPFTLHILRTTSEFNALAPEWRTLWQSDPHATPFQRPEWLLPWWHHFSQPDLYVVCVRQAGVLVGLLPFYVYADSVRGERQLLLIGAGTSDYLDGVFAPQCTTTAIAAALSSLAGEPTWDVAHLAQLPLHSPLLPALAHGVPQGLRRYVGEPTSRCPALFIADLPKKVRSEVRYFRNAAVARGKLTLHVADADTWPAFWDALVHLHTTRWQANGQAGVLADPAVLQWHQEALPQLLAAGCLRLYVLQLDQAPIAALYALIDPPERAGRTVYFYLIGYSPSHAALRPGTLLSAMASEHAAAEGALVLDMLRGDETYKKFWHVEETPTNSASFARVALGGRC